MFTSNGLTCPEHLNDVGAREPPKTRRKLNSAKQMSLKPTSRKLLVANLVPQNVHTLIASLEVGIWVAGIWAHPPLDPHLISASNSF